MIIASGCSPTWHRSWNESGTSLRFERFLWMQIKRESPHWEHLFGVERWVRLSNWQCLSLQFTFVGRWSSWKFKSCKVVANNNYGILRPAVSCAAKVGCWEGYEPYGARIACTQDRIGQVLKSTGPILWVYPAFTGFCYNLLGLLRVLMLLVDDQLIREDAVRSSHWLRQELISLWRTGDPVWTWESGTGKILCGLTCLMKLRLKGWNLWVKAVGGWI